MNRVAQPFIKDLALIGDQKSCACIDKEGTVAWYCLWRFDQPSLFSLLVDECGGYWSIAAKGKKFKQREYKGNTTILLSEYEVEGGHLTVTDFMPYTKQLSGICRIFSASPTDISISVFPTPDYGRSAANLKRKNENVIGDDKFEFYVKASHALDVNNGKIEVVIPTGESGWCVLVDDERALPYITFENLQTALRQTEEAWNKRMQNITYDGPYKEQLYQAYKAIQLVTHAHSGGILAAGTTSLPETVGGERNYDYRYVWLRDTAMNVSAIIRAGSRGKEAERFLDFLCTARHTNKKNLFVPFYDLDNKTAPGETVIPGTGYRRSTPIRTGNGAFDQLQLDAQGNVLLAAKEIYQKNNEKPHWKTIEKTADYLVKHWAEKDHGIWEEHRREHYTSSKVIVAKSLEFLAMHTGNEAQKEKWVRTALQIRNFVSQHCMTPDGAYAVYAGSNAVDVTAALYAVWWYDKPDSGAMKQTIKRIEAEYREGDLYHRHLVESNSRNEGVFLAGSLWMAQHYVMRRELNKAKTIMDAVLSFATDLGFLPEEGNVKTGEPLGNLPQTFVHASLMGVILDYKEAMDATIETASNEK